MMPRSPVDDFQKAFGPGAAYRPCSAADAARLAGRVPPVMLEILRREGWCSYRDQVLWLTDPDDWTDVADAWFPGAQVFARTAFGDLCVWDGELFWYVMAHESVALGSVDDANWFFARTLCAPD